MKTASNQLLVIFGASGDLTGRKLLPSLYELHVRGLLPERFCILGAARTEYTDDEYRAFEKVHIRESLKNKEVDDAELDSFLRRVFYLAFDSTNSAGYHKLKDRIHQLRQEQQLPDKIIYYLATPPVMYELIPTCLKENGMNVAGSEDGWRRVIVEKPFGTSLESAERLNKHLIHIFDEKEIYRIDHYLGKETVQNIMVTRFGSTIYEPIWNRNYIDYVEITAVENMGIGTRGGYYDGSGALRDMVQNHLMQLLAITAMEPPAKFDKDGFRNEVIKVYQSLHPLTDEYIRENVIRGQYVAGETQAGYREEKNVNPDSRTDTYVAMCLKIDNWRWQGVPFYIRTGKQMPTKVTEIVVHFKPAPMQMFKMKEGFYRGEELILRIQPDEGILQRIAMKAPGSGFYMGTMEMDYSYDRNAQETGDAYVRLLEDSLAGDPTLFTRSDAVEESWTYFDKILDYWKKYPETPLYGYPAGTWGPKEADVLIERSHAEWTNPCKNLTHSKLYCLL